MLFYVVSLSLYVTSGVSYVALLLAWLFVALRYVHAWFHLTSNRVKYRSTAFIAGALLLALLWIWFALHLAGAA